jgi:DNA mismatch endonuclease (patch repair protein)
MMSGIRAKNTKPEMAVRRGLHARGFRFRLHAKGDPGKPDIVLTRFRAVIFVNGCFWHGHDCHLFRMPSTRPAFWKAKIARNIERDRSVNCALTESGWRTLIVWECAVKGRARLDFDALISSVAEWLRGGQTTGEIVGAP